MNGPYGPGETAEAYLALADKLEQLGACEEGCYGRCKECPDDLARQGAKAIRNLITKESN